MNDNAQFVPFEIDADNLPIGTGAVSCRSLQLAETRPDQSSDLLWQATEFAQDVELKFLRHLRQFRGAGRVKNDLEWSH